MGIYLDLITQKLQLSFQSLCDFGKDIKHSDDH